MSILNRIKSSKIMNIPAIRMPIRRFHAKAHVYVSERMNDRLYLQLKYRKVFGEWIDLRNPTSFQEKLQWLKLNDQKEVYHRMVDKYDAKEFITNKIGPGHVFPTLGVWDGFDEIDIDSLPEEFVLKATHDSDSVLICTDKDDLLRNLEDAKQQVEVHFNTDYFIWSREYSYKGLKPRIIAEPLLKDHKYGYLRDYKFMCFNGEPRLFYITAENGPRKNWRQDFFDLAGNHLPYATNKRKSSSPETETLPEPPENLELMVKMARELAADTHFLRVDFYEINGHVYVGELTFYDYGGFAEYYPKTFERELAEWLELPPK